MGAPLTDGLVADAGDRVGPSQFIGVSGSFSIDVGSGELVEYDGIGRELVVIRGRPHEKASIRRVAEKQVAAKVAASVKEGDVATVWAT